MRQVREFRKEVFAASELRFDSRWKAWAKWVDKVNPEGKDGYAFSGEFINSGTIEVEVGRPRLILVAATSGSNKYRTTDYRVVRMAADGSLSPTEIQTTDSTPGWALRIRDRLAEMLAEVRGESDSDPRAAMVAQIQVLLPVSSAPALQAILDVLAAEKEGAA